MARSDNKSKRPASETPEAEAPIDVTPEAETTETGTVNAESSEQVTPQTQAPAASVTDTARPAATPAPEPSPRKGGALALLGGGVIAALIGAGAVLLLLPQGWDRQPDAALTARIAALESTIEARESSQAAALETLAQQIDTLRDQLEGAADPAALDALADRLAALEAEGPARLSGAVDTALEAALDSAMAEFQARLNAAATAQAETAAQSLAETAASQEAIEAAAERQARRASLDLLTVAAETGAPAPEALAALAEWHAPPEALTPIASGLPSLGSLRQSFPTAARAALAAAPLPTDAPAHERFLGFLRSQTGARSLAPREGMDTDAILSRAEALLREGDLPASLRELDHLPEAPAAEMAGWRAMAQTRLEAMAALAALRAELEEG